MAFMHQRLVFSETDFLGHLGLCLCLYNEAPLVGLLPRSPPAFLPSKNVFYPPILTVVFAQTLLTSGKSHLPDRKIQCSPSCSLVSSFPIPPLLSLAEHGVCLYYAPEDPDPSRNSWPVSQYLPVGFPLSVRSGISL